MKMISFSWFLRRAFIGLVLVFACRQLSSQTISNYTFSASGGTFTALTSPINPALSAGNPDDGYFNSIPIGFEFWYMGVRYTSISASTNGWFTLGANITADVLTNNLVSGGAPRPVIAPLWDDLHMQVAGNVSYTTTGSAPNRVFSLQYLNAKWLYNASGNTISFQAKLYESTGRIEFIYRRENGAILNPSASIGITATQTGSGNFRSLNGAGTNPSVSSTSETTTINAKPATGQTYAFTPVVPAAPTNLTFSNVTTSSTTLNWNDNSTNEAGFVIYRSTDGTNYSFDRQTAANSTSAVVSGLSSNTNYFWRIYSVSVGAISSSFPSGSQATLCVIPPPPTVTSTITYCQNEPASPLSASGSNLIWGGGLVSGSAGGSNSLTTATYVDNEWENNNKKTNFTTLTGNVTIASVDYYIPAWQAVTNLRLAIFNSGGAVVASSPTTTTQTAGGTAIKITNTFNYTIPTAGDYSIGVLSGSGVIGSDDPNFPITEPTGTINITGVSAPASRCYNNIHFTADNGSAIAPTPSTAEIGSTVYTVTQTVDGCVSSPATITVNVTGLNISQTPTSDLIADYNFSGNALDESGNNNGSLQNNPSLTSDRFNISNKAYAFNGSTQYVSTSNSYTNPANFTISIWFKTSTTTGGKLIGFGNSQIGQSGNYDRHIYMNNAGQIYFGVYPGIVRTVNSTLSYNDNKWHNVTATLSGTSGMNLYIDGQVVAQNTEVTSGENFTGFWKIGGDNMNGWTSQPSSYYFNGTLDDAVIYHRSLSEAEVNALYVSPDGAGNSGPVCAGSPLNLTAKTVAGATYSWTGPNGFTSTLQNPTLTYTAANAGIYTLQITSSGCTGTAYTTVESSQNSGQWTGNVSTDWSDPNNWCNGIAPTSTTEVTIPSNAVRMPVISNSVNSYHLIVNSGASLTIAESGSLNIAGTLTNNGTVSNSGTVNFNGISGQQSFSGITSFHNLTLSNTDGLLLPNAITVNSNLLISAGTLNAANFNVVVKGNWTNNSAANSFTPGTGTVTFNGTVAQTIGGTFEANFYNLIVANTGSVTLTNNINIGGNLTVSTGIFNLSGFTANRSTSGGLITVSNNATLKIAGTNTFPVNYASHTLVVASTVEYSGTNQTVANLSYGNLVLSSSAGAAIKVLPATPLTVVGNLIGSIGAGTSVSFTAASNITVNGHVSLGTSTTFNGDSFSHRVGGNWINDGIFNGNTSTVTLTGTGSSVNGSGSQNFNNLTVAASGITFSSADISLTGNLATTGPGSFIQSTGSLLVMSGAGKTINGTGILLNDLIVSGIVSTVTPLDLKGDLTVSGSFTTGIGSFIMSGASKTISGLGSKNFGNLSITGSVTTDTDFSISSGLLVSGSLSASSGTVTFTGTSALGGIANLFNTVINGTSLQLSSNSVLGVAGALTINEGFLDVTSSVPNTVNFNGTGAQNINAITYDNLLLSNGNTKTATGNLTTAHDITIGTGTTLNGASYTYSVFGNWNNNGTFTAGTSNVQFLGPATAYIRGATTFNVLTSNTSSSATVLIFQANVTADIVNMTNGIITTGTNTLTITDTRTGNGIIMGNIQRTHAFATGIAYAFEGPENTITFSAVSSVNSVTVSVEKGSISDFPFGGSISRVYTMTVPTGNYSATLRLHYESDELNGNSEDSMELWRFNGSAWAAVGKTGNNSTANYVEQSGLTDITNRWTLSDDSNVVQWNGSVSTDWNTAANWTVLQGAATAPPSSNDVVNLGNIAFTHHPVISNEVNVKSVIFGSTQSLSLSLASGGSLTSGDIKGTWSSNATHTINSNDQNISINGDLSLSGGINGQSIDLQIGSGSVNVAGSVFQSGNASVDFTSNGILNIYNDYDYTGGSFQAGSGTVVYNGMEHQEIADVPYYNLTINKAEGRASVDSVTSILGNLVIAAGGLDNFSELTVAGNVDIYPGTSFNNYHFLNVGGNWTNNGSYTATGAQIRFNGSGAQTISASTFNNVVIDKPVGSSAVLTGNMLINGNLTINSGTLNIMAFICDRIVPGGAITLTDSATFIVGGNNPPANFTGGSLANSSTVIADGTGPQMIFGEGYGNLILRNSGLKTLVSPITVNGDLTIESGAVFDGNSNTITLNGNWINSGTFTPSSSTALFAGVSKNISGNTTFNHATITGSYTILHDVTFNGLLHITASGTISGGSTTHTTLHGDLINSGRLVAMGTTTYSGNVVQTLSLINAVQTVALTVNFNGSVSPVLNSTSPPQFGFLNINNSGGINPSVNWAILYNLTIGNGASFNGGELSHTLMGSVTNNGSITSDGILNFVPSSAATLNLGNDFSSTGTVVFGGAGAVTFAGTAGSFHDVLISNTNLAGINTSSDWNIANDLTIDTGAALNAENHTYWIGGDFLNKGTFNRGTSTFIMDGNVNQNLFSNSAFNNLTVNKESGSVNLQTSVTVEGELDFISGIIGTENYHLILPASGSINGAADSTGWINGNLQKHIATGTTDKNFEVGDDAHFTPISVVFESVTGPGNLTVKTVSADHPNLSTSTFRNDRTVNRYWSFTNSGVEFSSADLTMNWVAEDLDQGSVTENFGVGIFGNATWSYYPASAALPTSIQSLDVPSLDDVVVGQACTLTTDFVYPETLFCSATGTVTPILTGTAGTFSSASGLSINPLTGEIDLEASLPGNYSIVNNASGAGGCSSTSIATVSIGIVPEVSFQMEETCEGESTGTITALVSNGFPPYTFSLNGGDFQTSNEFTGLAAGTFTLEVKGNGGCSVTDSVTVTSYNPSATIAYAESVYRTDESSATVIQTGTPGGVYSSSAGLTIDPLTGEIFLSTSTVGTYLIVYTIESTGGCGTFQTTTTVTIQEACGADFTWLGNNSDWFDPINWCGGQVPPILGTTQHIILSASGNDPIIGISQGAGDVVISGDLFIDFPAQLSITTEASLTLSATSNVFVEEGTLIVIEDGAVYKNLGHGVPILKIHQTLTGHKGWRMLGAPLLTTYGDLLNGLVTQGFSGSDFPDLQPNIMWWDETDKGTSLQGWRQPQNISTEVLPGRGHYVYVFDSAAMPGGLGKYQDNLPINLSPSGSEISLFDTGFSFDVTYTPRDTSLITSGDSALVEVNIADEGFNLLANPTPSTIDFFAESGWTKNNIDQAVYVWDPNFNGGQGAFRTSNGIVGNINSGLLAPFQGFWIRANASAPELILNNSGKSSIPTAIYGRKLIGQEPLNLQFHLKGDGMQVDSYISFSEGGKEGFDPYDAYQLESLSDNWLMLYTYGSLRTSSPLMINNLPALNEQERSIPLHVTSSKGGAAVVGKYNLQWELPTEWPVEVSIVLMDHIREVAIDMTAQNNYDFDFKAPKVSDQSQSRLDNGLRTPKAVVFQSPYESGEPNMRVDKSSPQRPFTILVGGEYRGGIVEYRPDVPRLFVPYPNPFQSKVNISFFLPVEGEAEIRITDMQGREKAHFPSKKYSTGTHELVWEGQDVSAGMYIIQLLSEGNLFSQKLIKN